MALLPDKYNFTIWKGSTFRTRLLSYTDQGVTLRDLTNNTAALNIRDPATPATVLLALTTSNGGITLGGSAGTIDLLIVASATAALTWKSGIYDLTVTQAVGQGGDTLPLLYGSFAVKGVT